MAITALAAAAFVGMIGVNTHIAYLDGNYASLGNVIAELKYLGTYNVRDGISNGAHGSAPISSYEMLARDGVKFTFIAPDSTGDTAGLQAGLGLIDRVARANPGSVVAVEGPNEINNWPITYNGVGGLQGAINFQRDLYAKAHADTNLPGIKVIYFTGYDVVSGGPGPNPATTPGLADYNNAHPYPKGGNPPRSVMNPANALSNEPTPGPAVYTETGYSTTIGSWSTGVSPMVQAKYTLDLLFDAASFGIPHVWLYELNDGYKPGSRQGDAGFGLFDWQNQPKPVAYAIHNLTSILSDTGTSRSEATLAYSLSGQPASTQSLLMRKSNGNFELAVWAEPALWNTRSGEQNPVATSTTVHLGRKFDKVNVYDPLAGSAALASYANISSVVIPVSDHPIIVEAFGAGPRPHQRSRLQSSRLGTTSNS